MVERQLRAVRGADRAAVLEQLRATLASRPAGQGGHGRSSQIQPARIQAAPSPRPTEPFQPARPFQPAPWVDPDTLLPVLPPLAELLPDGGLRRGAVVSILSPGAEPASLPAGGSSLLLALLSAASAAGSWAAVVGVGDLGAHAAAELGVDLSRLALVPHPGPNLTGIAAALLDGVDLLAVAGVERLAPAERARLAARARQSGSVLLPLGPWPGADVVLRCSAARWAGAGETGRGRLRGRELTVSAGGRGRLAAGCSVVLRLPGPDGRVEAVREVAVGEVAGGPVAARTVGARRGAAGTGGSSLRERAG